MNRVRRAGIAIGVTSVAVAGVAPGASAAPRTTVAAAGLQVSWPAGKTVRTVKPGSTHRITVRRTGKAGRSARARVTVTRSLPGKRGSKVILRRAVRKGAVTLRASKRAATTYRVVVRVGSRTWTHRIRVQKPAAKATPPAVGPAAPSGPVGPVGPPQGQTPVHTPCPLENAQVVDLQLPDPVQAGDVVSATVVNRSVGNVAFGRGTGWEQRDGDGWTRMPLGASLPTTADLLWLPPGGSTTLGVEVWSPLAPGVYRATLSVTCTGPMPGSPRAATPRSVGPVEFTVTSNPVTVVAAE